MDIFFVQEKEDEHESTYPRHTNMLRSTGVARLFVISISEHAMGQCHCGALDLNWGLCNNDKDSDLLIANLTFECW